jgi:hypothetical protein
MEYLDSIEWNELDAMEFCFKSIDWIEEGWDGKSW